MFEQWIMCNNIPSGGLDILVDDQRVWTDSIQEFGIECEIKLPLTAKLSLLPQSEGYLVRGVISGVVILPCDLCAEPTEIKILHKFDSFESYPQEDDFEQAEDSSDALDESALRLGESGLELNIAALLWEEFSLTLPVHPVCSESCKGVCVNCGKNLNQAACGCEKEQGDARLSVLKNLKIIKK